MAGDANDESVTTRQRLVRWARTEPIAATFGWGGAAVALYAWTVFTSPGPVQYREAYAYAIAIVCFWRLHVVSVKLHQLRQRLDRKDAP